MSLPYAEGDWFAVPLSSGGFASGVVARSSTKGRVLLGYFFGPRRPAPARLQELEALTPQDAILVARFGDLSLVRGEWAVLGRSTWWNRDEWPMPPFVNRDPLTEETWKVEYSDKDPNVMTGRSAIFPEEGAGLEPDRVCGAGSIEVQVDKLLQPQKV